MAVLMLVLFSREAGPTLTHPWREREQLPTKMRLLVAQVSGLQSKIGTSAKKQRLSLWRPGALKHKNSTKLHSKNGISIVVKGEEVLCLPI